MKRSLLLFLCLMTPVWAVTRSVTISAPATVNTGQSITIPTSASTSATDSEQIGFYHAEYSTNGGSSWSGFCFDVNVGKSATRNAFITAGAVGTQIKIRVRIAFRGGGAGDVDYAGGGINWGGSWGNWGTPPTVYATVNVVAAPNAAPTVSWEQAPTNVAINSWVPVQAKGEDADGNLSIVLVWRNWSPHAFTGATNGYLSYSDPNSTTASSVMNVPFQAKADDSAGADSGFITHTVNFVDTVSPTDTAHLRATNITTTSISLVWSGSTDNSGSLDYQISRDGSIVATTTSATATLSGLAPHTKYLIRVRARDGSSNTSAWSGEIAIWTLDDDSDPNNGDGIEDYVEALLGTDPNSSATANPTQINLKIHQPASD